METGNNTAAVTDDPHAVYFAAWDYASFIRRLIAFCADLFFALILSVCVALLVRATAVPAKILQMPNTPERTIQIGHFMQPYRLPMFLGILGLFVIYHVLLRSTGGGTLGHRLTGTRIIDFSGQTPSQGVLLKRFLLALPACSMFGLSYFLCLFNLKRQAFHDQFSGTWVVRKWAQPQGPATLVFDNKILGSFVFTRVDVQPQVKEPADDSTLTEPDSPTILSPESSSRQ